MAARTDGHGRAIGIAMLALLLTSLVTNSSARAQAGSIGGSVGPTEKTLSGERSAVAPPAAAQPKAERRSATANRGNAAPPAETAAAGSRCQMLLGSWSFSNGVGVVFKAGGDLSSTAADGPATTAWSRRTGRTGPITTLFRPTAPTSPATAACSISG